MSYFKHLRRDGDPVHPLRLPIAHVATGGHPGTNGAPTGVAARDPPAAAQAAAVADAPFGWPLDRPVLRRGE